MSGGCIRQIIVIAASVGCALGQPGGAFIAAGSMTIARSGHTATLLADGRVLIASGAGDASTEIYDPSTGVFTVTGSMSTPRHGASATLLADGRVLIVGGNPLGAMLPSAELYEPASGRFVTTGSLSYPRSGHTAILLSNGKVLILGGYGASGYPEVAPAEIYDPDTGIFTPTGPYAGNGGCDFCTPSAKLADGRVLFPQQNQAQLYDPAASTFSLTGRMIDDHNAATLLVTGKVLFAGGEDDFGRKSDAEVYDPGAGVFSSTGDMLSKRSGHTLTLLPDGKVLAAGGETDLCNAGFCYFAGTLATAELYDPLSGAFSATGNMLEAREGHTATLLNDGTVLLTGGVAYGGIDAFYGSTASAELYTRNVGVPAPGLFSLPGGIQGQGAVWHSSTGQSVSPAAPAIAGEALSMYARGLTEGGVIPPQVFIGGRSAEVLYFGDAPGYPFLNQVNVRVPEGIAAGSQVPVRLSYLDRASNQVVIAVQ